MDKEPQWTQSKVAEGSRGLWSKKKENHGTDWEMMRV